MNNQQFYYQQGESYNEEYQQYVDSTPEMESYDPSLDDSDLPYMPSMGGVNQYQAYQQHAQRPNPSQGFIDLSNPQSYAVMNEAPMQNPIPAMMQSPQDVRPNFGGAQTNMSMLSGVLSKIGNIVDESDPQGKSVKNYATAVAIKNLKTACQMLKEVDLWIPEGKEEYAPKLKKIAQPITQALDAYIQKINELN